MATSLIDNFFEFQTQDRRKSYTRPRKQYKRPLVADSEHEDDENDEVEEPVKKSKKYKVKPRKKQVDPKEKSAVSTSADISIELWCHSK